MIGPSVILTTFTRQISTLKCHFINLQQQVQSARKSGKHPVSSTFSACGGICKGSQIIIIRQPGEPGIRARRANWPSDWNVKPSGKLRSPLKDTPRGIRSTEFWGQVTCSKTDLHVHNFLFVLDTALSYTDQACVLTCFFSSCVHSI